MFEHRASFRSLHIIVFIADRSVLTYELTVSYTNSKCENVKWRFPVSFINMYILRVCNVAWLVLKKQNSVSSSSKRMALPRVPTRIRHNSRGFFLLLREGERPPFQSHGHRSQLWRRLRKTGHERRLYPSLQSALPSRSVSDLRGYGVEEM